MNSATLVPSLPADDPAQAHPAQGLPDRALAIDFALRRLAYHGREVRSDLARPSAEGAQTAGADVFTDEVCMCRIVSCMRFDTASGAIKRKATQWIDERERAAKAVR
jgi:hypothetical protein